MSYNVQQVDLEVIRQHEKKIHIKLELLNRHFKTIERLEGHLQQDDYSIDVESEIRRTYKATLIVKDSTFSIGRDKKIWFDKYIKIFIGITNIRTQEIHWYPMGIYIFDSMDYSFDATTNTLVLSCLDRTAELIGERNGQLSGITTSIPTQVTVSDKKVDNMIRSAMVDTIVQLGQITKYRIEDIGEPIPYDLDFGVGSYVWDIVRTLRDLYPGWETFFDGDEFICQPIPTHLSDPIILDANTIDFFLISSNTQFDLSNVKNVTEIWGKCLEADYYTNSVIMDSNGVYQANYDGMNQLVDKTTFGFKASDSSLFGTSFKINDFLSYPILGENNNPIVIGRIQKDRSYVIQYIQSGGNSYFYFMGEYQICAVTKLVSKYPNESKIQYDLLNEPTRNISYIIQPDSPFCSDFDDVGEIRQVLSSGEYENIFSESLALQRAEYENWKKTDLLDTITLTMIDIPWIHVNQKIEYTSKVTGKTNIYLIKSKKGSSTSGLMTINCIKFQPLYPWLT